MVISHCVSALPKTLAFWPEYDVKALAASTCSLQVAIRTTHWTFINHALIWGTLALWLPFLALLQGLCGSVPGLAPLCGLGSELLGSSGFWLGAVIGAPAAALLLDYTILVFQRQFAPRASQLLQEVEKLRQRGLKGVPVGAAAAGRQQQVELPAHGPDVEQQYRQQQQQAEPLPAAVAATSQQQQLGGGIIAVAHMPAAAAAGGGDAAGSSVGSNLQLLGAGGAAGADVYDAWGPGETWRSSALRLFEAAELCVPSWPCLLVSLSVSQSVDWSVGPSVGLSVCLSICQLGAWGPGEIRGGFQAQELLKLLSCVCLSGHVCLHVCLSD